MLRSSFEKQNNIVLHAENDADNLIVQKPVESTWTNRQVF